MVRTTVIAALVVNDLPIIIVTGWSPIISLFGCMGSVTLHASDSRKIRRAIDIVDRKGKIRNTDGRGPIVELGRFAAELSTAEIDCAAVYKLPWL